MMQYVMKRSVRAIPVAKIAVKEAPQSLLDLIEDQGRILKIQPQPRETMSDKFHVPEIKLCGKWLQQAGFEHGKIVKVTTLENVLILSLEEDFMGKKKKAIKKPLPKRKPVKV